MCEGATKASRWTVAWGAAPLLWRVVCGGRGVPGVSGVSGGRLVLARPAPAQVASLHEFRVVHHPERAEVVFVPHETFVQWQVRPDSVL